MERKIQKIEPFTLKLPTKKRVAAYARVSSGKEAMLHSLSAQISYYSNFVQNHHGWDYIGVYADEALTGTKDNRAEFQRLLADCRDSKIDMVITKSISRFARNTVTMLETVRELKGLNVDIYFEKENIHSMSGDGELMLTILSSFAQEESLSVSENCKWRIRKGFKEGKLVNLRFLFGYKIKNYKITIDDKQANIVKMIFNDYLSGLGSFSIAKKLQEMKIPTRFGGKWSEREVLDILKNEKYTGTAILQKRFVENHLTKKRVKNNGQLDKYEVISSHPAIIDKDIYDKVQTEIVRHSKKYNPEKNNQNRYPFTGKLICSNCGKHFKRRSTHKGKPYEKIMWQCPTYLNEGKNKCFAKQIPEDVLYKITEDINCIEKILVTYPNILKYILKDGKEYEILW